MKNITLKLFCMMLSTIILCCPNHAVSQTSANAAIPWQTLDSGGNTGQSANYIALHSVGQSSAIGWSANSANLLAGGFYAHILTRGDDATCVHPIVFESDRDGDREIFMMCPDGSNVQQLTFNTCMDGRPSLSPDGTKIAFMSDCDGDHEIYTMNVDGSNRQQLTTNTWDDGWPMWSPDGTKILFDSIRPEHESRQQLYVMNGDGTEQRRIGFSDIGDERSASWSPDSNKITFQSTRINGRHWDVYSMNADGSNVTLLTPNLYAVDGWPSYSPNGEKILFSTNGCAGDLDAANNYDMEICVMNTDGTGQVKLTDNGTNDQTPRWSPTGEQIVFTSLRDGTQELYIMNADGSNQSRLTDNTDIEMFPDWGIAPVNPNNSEMGVINKIHQISDGGYIVVGEMPNPDGDQNNHQNKDLWVLRLDSQGHTIWQRRYGQPDTWESAMVASVLETPDQGFIVTGGFMQDPDSSAWKVLVLKLTGSGDIAWSYTYGQPDSLDFAYDTQLTNDGGCIVIGATDIFWDTQQRDMWMIKLNAQGQVMWQKAYHLNSELGLKIRATSDNGYVAMGRTQDELFWLKLDASGNIVQQQLYRAANFTWVRDMQLTSDGGVIVSDVQYNDGKIHLMKLDVHGTVEWYQTYALNTSYNNILSVTVMPDQGYVLTGSAENNRCWLLKVAQTGQVVWQKTFQGLFDAQKSFTSNAALTADGGLAVAGRTWLNETVNEAFVLKLDADGECCLPSETHAVSANAGSVTQRQGALTVSTTDVAPLAHALPAAAPNVPVVPMCFDAQPQMFDYFMHEDPAHPGRFHDADKTGNNDSYKCHAAASSNILDWGGWDAPPEFDVEQQIFGNFQTNWENKGSLVKYIGDWWLDGTVPPAFGNDWATVTGTGGGHFPTGTELSNFSGAYLSHWTQATLIDTIKSYLHSGYGSTIALYDSTDSLAVGHVLSVWGYRYDAEDNVVGLWVTDSDDSSSEPPQEWLLSVEYSTGGGSVAKWRVSANSSTPYDGWLLEGVEALKPHAMTTPTTEALPKLAIVRKKCVDNETGEEAACPENDDVTIWIGDQVCDEECKRIIVPTESGTALYLRVLMDPTNFKGLEVNGEMWNPGDPIIMTDDLYLRPVIGRCHH